MGLLASGYKYFMVLVLSASISRFTYLCDKTKHFLDVVDHGIAGYSRLLQRELDIELPGLEIQPRLGLELSQKIQTYLWWSLLLLPLVSVLGFKKHMALGFVVFGTILLMELPAYEGNFEKYFAEEHRLFALFGLSGLCAVL